MKKFLLSLATLLCAGTFASAGEVTFSFYTADGVNNYGLEPAYTDANTKHIANGSTATQGPVTITLNETNSNAEAWRNWSDGLRAYGKSKKPTLTVSGSNVTITAVSFSLKAALTIAADNGAMSNTTSTKTNSWAGNASDVTFTLTGGNNAIQVLTITYAEAGGVTVDAPTFSLESGKYTEAQTVSISAADGCSIYYTTDGQTPTDDTADGSTNLYTGPITISTTTTLKAIAFDADDNKSAVATATYTIVELLEGAEGDGTEANPYNAVGAYNEAILGSTATVYVKGIVVSKSEINTKYGSISYYISEDGTETNQFYIYSGLGLGGQKFTVDEELNVGDNVVVKGTLTTYKGAPQIDKNSEIVSINGETPAPIELEGDGTEANPFTVADIIKINPTASDKNEDYPDNYWVKGYIVGRVDGMAYSPVFSATAVDETTAVSITNIVLGPTADTADKNLCIPVQLVIDSDIRTALNLLDNPENLGKEVYVYGNIYKYFSVPAVKNTSDYKFAGSDSAIAVEIDANAPVEFFNLQGVRVDNPTNGLYIMRQGDKVVKVIK